MFKPECVFLLLFVGAAAAFGQTTSSLRGVIKDASGASVPDSAITLTDKATGTSRKVLSDSAGLYQLLQVPPGTYNLTVEKTGFSVLTRKDIALEVNVPATLDLVLEVGSVGATVSVEAEATQINTVDATVGNAFQEHQVAELPLQTRNVVELLSIQPGVTQTGEVLGAHRDQNNITLDGVDVNNNQTSGVTSVLNNGSQSGATGNTPGFNAALPVPLDSVEEFRVTVAGQTADEGRSSGGQVALITRSGTNVIHASAYEYNRNTLLAADDFFNNQAGVPRSPLVRNQFGIAIGGPIKKNKLFLFANWERRIDASSTPATANVPSATLRQGELLAQLSNGTSTIVQTFTPAQVQQIDPLGIGFSPAMKAYLNSFQLGNDPALSLDNNLNFNTLRFNAPLDLDQNAYVAKLDYNIDQAGRHHFSVRGTLNDASQDLLPAPLPGQPPEQVLLDNSKGLASNYTWVVRPNLINSLKFGVTRLGLNESGPTGTALSFSGITSPEGFSGFNVPRATIQLMPTWNVADDLTWIKGKHTVSAGVNLRFIRNTRNSYTNSFPSYSFSRDTLGGLGGDATTDVEDYANQLLGTSGYRLTQPAAVQEGLGNLLGLINEYDANYQYTKSGSVIPFGMPAVREYATNEYEEYLTDSWRIRPGLTVTAGLRYSNSTPPWEVNGTEVATTVPLQDYFASRVAAMNAGIPNNQIPDASLTYTLGGSANGKPGWFSRDNLDFGPRASIAWAPDKSDSWITKLMGKGSVIRGGYAMLYDQYGQDMVFNVDQSGSPGLASTVTQPINTNFTTSPRYTGSSGLPTLPPAAPGGFPFTPPTITGGFDEGVGIASNLKAPYSHLFNANYARPLPGNMVFEAGYSGRLYRRGLVQQDFDQPLTNFLDTKSGTTWSQAMGVLQNDYLAAGQNYGSINNVPFIQNMFPALANAFVPGSATQNYYYGWVVINGLSPEDNLNLMDRQRIPGTDKCYTVTGCNTFYPLQFAGLPTWTNNAYSDYNALTISLRRRLAKGFSFDFNYTWSHSINNSSGAESGAGQSGAVLQNAFNINSFLGSSDFDERHNITADALYELPFGKGRMLFKDSGKFVDTLIGGWEATTIVRYHSGLPSTITAGGVYPTNYEQSALANLLPGAPNNYGNYIDNNGVPSLFPNTSAVGNYFQEPGGTTGERALVRLPGMFNVDLAIMKSFALPWEGHRLQFRAEAFNAFNHVNVYNPILDINNTAQFGEFQNAMPARVMQLSLRYSF